MNIAMAHAEAKMSAYEKNQLAKAMNEKKMAAEDAFPKAKKTGKRVFGYWYMVWYTASTDLRTQEEPMQATTTVPIKCHKGLYSLRPG